MTINRRATVEKVIPNIPGRYLCRLEFELALKAYSNEIECNNPVYGFAQLEEWEGLITKRHESRMKAA